MAGGEPVMRKPTPARAQLEVEVFRRLATEPAPGELSPPPPVRWPDMVCTLLSMAADESGDDSTLGELARALLAELARLRTRGGV